MDKEGADALLSNTSLAERALRIRRHALRMGEVQGQGYVGQALGVADVLAVAYFHALRYRPDDPAWDGRDRFLLSVGHYAIALYAALIEAGILPEEEIETYGRDRGLEAYLQHENIFLATTEPRPVRVGPATDREGAAVVPH